MRLNPKALIVGVVAVALLAFGAMQASAHIPPWDDGSGGCSPTYDTNTIQDMRCLGVVDLASSNLHDLDNDCLDAVPFINATFGAGMINPGAILSHTINDIVPICFQHFAGTNTAAAAGNVAFDSNDVGRWLTAICANKSGTGADFEFSTFSSLSNTAYGGADECVNLFGKGDDFMIVPPEGFNNLGILAFYQCPPVNSIANITIDHAGEIVSFSITCIGPAAQATIGVSPSTVEIIPMPGSQSYSRVTVTVADALGNRIDGVEVDLITDNCWWRNQVATQDSGSTSPRGGLDANVRTTVVFSDTDTSASSNEDGEGSTQDTAYINTVLGQVSGQLGLFNQTTGVPVSAGTAEADLQCFPGTDTALAALVKPGPANIQAIIRRTGTPGLCPINTTGIVATASNNLSALTGSSLANCGALFGFPQNFGRTGFLPYGFEDIILTATVTVIGPPASITVAASPTSLRCGEKSTITATIKDALGANVSDHTRVELITNLGGVLAGTGAVTAGLGAGVVPISSTVAETFAGVATAFLLTSEVTTGPYEVVVTAGGSFPVFTGLQIPSQTSFTNSSTAFASPFGNATFLGGGGDISPISGVQEPGTVGVFSTAPVSAQTTVQCALPTPAAPPAPAITAPRTGTGITPPNTGDAGLADSSGSSTALFAIGSLIAFAIAGVVTLKFARR